MKGSDFKGTLGFLVAQTPLPFNVEAPRPRPDLWKGLTNLVCAHLDSEEFFRIHVSMPLGARQGCGRPRRVLRVEVLMHKSELSSIVR